MTELIPVRFWIFVQGCNAHSLGNICRPVVDRPPLLVDDTIEITVYTSPGRNQSGEAGSVRVQDVLRGALEDFLVSQSFAGRPSSHQGSS